MAFRIEVVDDFRLQGLAYEIYRDIIRYGLFLRDARGKSVRGAMVPRLYIRRLLLPYCTLALSKRDSVQMICEMFNTLLLLPDEFKEKFPKPKACRETISATQQQISMPFMRDTRVVDALYDDLEPDELLEDQVDEGTGAQ
jgi:hypothetical protein